MLTSDRFVDLAPLQIYAQLLDEGVYLCSVSTMYRVLAEHTLVAERRRLARHPAKVCPELVATAPRQVYSWDITKLAGAVKGTYFDAYVMIDIYSRYIVGVEVHTHESGLLAKELMEEIFKVHGVPQVVHADRGTSMTSKTVAALLADLEVTRSHSRPRVSNDNPYSESLFKTLKYGPEFPERFGSLCEARQFMDTFTNWYNHEHRHTGIGLHTPADVHFGLATDKGRPVARYSPRPAPDTRTASARPTHRRSSTYPTPSGSTDQPPPHRGDRHDRRLHPLDSSTLKNSGHVSAVLNAQLGVRANPFKPWPVGYLPLSVRRAAAQHRATGPAAPRQPCVCGRWRPIDPEEQSACCSSRMGCGRTSNTTAWARSASLARTNSKPKPPTPCADCRNRLQSCAASSTTRTWPTSPSDSTYLRTR